ncbi:MAG: SpoVA/SpoVAEb family sporulation membrane protein [Ruminococcaceae bacterium]|nr:SpoVA/SpoVAEb family sporulation membrane protein [Oscillospiraceae bacterium]
MNYLLAFLSGGVLCGAAQLLIDLTKLTPARILVAFVVFGVGLSAFGWYVPLRETFGCGITVPLVGFGGAIGEGVKKAVAEEGVLGILSGSLTAASVGTTAALIAGLFAALFAKSRPKQL